MYKKKIEGKTYKVLGNGGTSYSHNGNEESYFLAKIMCDNEELVNFDVDNKCRKELVINKTLLEKLGITLVIR